MDSDNQTIIVTAERRVASVGKDDTPIKLTPSTINIVDRELLDLRQPRNFVEALRTIPGISQSSPRISTQNMRSRGFSLRQAGGEFRNGVRHFETSNLAPELTNVDRFEILKGPASVLFGIGGLGGALNVVTKTPSGTDRFVAAEATVGSFGFYRAAIDANMPLTGDGTWSARVNAHQEAAGSFQDGVDQDSVLFSPTLAWRPDDRTSLVIDIEYLRADLSGNRTGIPADGSAIPGPSGRLARDLQIFDPNFNSIVRSQIYAGYSFERRVTDSVTFRQNFLFAASPENDLRESNQTGFVDGFGGPARRIVRRNAALFRANWESVALDTNLAAKVSTGGIDHELLAGVDLYHDDVRNRGQGAPLPNFDLFAPVYGAQPTGPFAPTNATNITRRWAGLYIQDTVIPHPEVRILLSGRVNWTGVRNENLLNPALNRVVENTSFVPRLGAVWTPIQPISLFVGWSRSFFPVVGANQRGELFRPEEGESLEGGVKLALGRMSATAAVFDMVRTGVTTADPANPLFQIQTGEQTSRGVELEVDGEVLPGWRLTAAYTYLDTAIARDNTLLTGQPFQGVPDEQFSLWTTYRLRSGPLSGLGLSGGVFHETSRWGQLVTPANAAQVAFRLPGYTRVDLGASWTLGKFDAIVAVENVTGERYFTGALSRLLVYPGAPTSVTATLRARF